MLGVAENAKKLWLEELPASYKHGEIGNGRKVDNSNCSLHNASASGLLSRLKRDHPHLAQRVGLMTMHRSCGDHDHD